MLRSTYLHSGWEFADRTWTETEVKIGTSRPTWLPAQVPGHVHLDLAANGVIEDPFRRMNELGCQWVDRKDWSYRTSFNFAADPSLPKRSLRFEGLDTLATVSLNGKEVGRTENMFVPLELDVSDSLIEGVNELQVDFQSAVETGLQRREAYFATEGLPQTVKNFDERAFVRKAQYMSGWDWGPRLVSCGIWRPVSLVEYASRLAEISIKTLKNEDGEDLVEVSAEGEGLVEFTLLSPIGVPVDTREGDGTLAAGPEALVWEPHTSGRPHLYRLIATLKDPGGAVLDEKSLSFGFRTVALKREADGFGESFEFVVNGEPFWARGANWIPDHSFPSVVSRRRYREQLERAVAMGCNMLRVWGGGLYETDEFYELCDELGILVWQDFPFACSYYPDDQSFRDAVAHEAAVNIRRLRHHPSLALWCANNENHQMWHDKWGGLENSPPRYYGHSIYHATLPETLADLDPDRPYIPSSGIGATTDGDDANPNRGGFGDQHNWDVWHGRGDWRFYAESTGRFSSEYGFGSSCHLDVWRATIDAADWGPHSPVVQWHDKTAKGHEVFHGLVQLHYPAPETLEDWVYYSQLNQRDALRFGVEFYRRSEFCKGSLIWQLNDCWPVQSWAILDSHGSRKALGYELSRLHANATSSIVRDKETFSLWAINDSAFRESGDAHLHAYDLQTGELLRTATESGVMLAGSERRSVLQLSIEGLPVSRTLVVGGWGGDQTWQLVAEPKAADYAAPAPLTISTFQDGLLTIKTETPLVDLFLLDGDSPGPFDQNFVTVPAPGTFTVRVTEVPATIRARSLAGEHLVKLVRGPL